VDAELCGQKCGWFWPFESRVVRASSSPLAPLHVNFGTWRALFRKCRIPSCLCLIREGTTRLCAMDAHTAFTAWCLSNDITITSIAPCHFPGRGLGIAATAPIKVPIPRHSHTRPHARAAADRRSEAPPSPTFRLTDSSRPPRRQ